MGQAKLKKQNENIILKHLDILNKLIEENFSNDKCHSISFFVEDYFKQFNIEVKPVLGYYKIDDKYTCHSWNLFNGKILDLSINKQSKIKREQVILEKNTSIYYDLNNLPFEYCEQIQTQAYIREDFLLNKQKNSSLTIQELEELSYLNQAIDEYSIFVQQKTKPYLYDNFKESNKVNIQF